MTEELKFVVRFALKFLLFFSIFLQESEGFILFSEGLLETISPWITPTKKQILLTNSPMAESYEKPIGDHVWEYLEAR